MKNIFFHSISTCVVRESNLTHFNLLFGFMSKQENEAKSVGKVTDYVEERTVDTSSTKLALSSSSQGEAGQE